MESIEPTAEELCPAVGNTKHGGSTYRLAANDYQLSQLSELLTFPREFSM
jgi:hypothetical protein